MGKAIHRWGYDWHTDLKVANTQTYHLLTRLPMLSMGTHIADFPVLPFPLQSFQLLFTLIHGLCNCIEDKVTNDALRYNIAMILLAADLLHDSLSLLLVPENNKEIALIREVKLQGHIAEEKRAFVILDNFIVRPMRFRQSATSLSFSNAMLHTSSDSAGHQGPAQQVYPKEWTGRLFEHP